MNAKHTPGPWIVNYDGLNIDTKQDGGIEQVARVSRTNEEREANARLIAAAPDLLDALKEIEERADSNARDLDPESDAHSGFIRIRDDARLALSKATESGVSRG